VESSEDPLAYDYLNPVTATGDRYGGTYSGGRWLAFPVDPWRVPEEPFSDDVTTCRWWDECGDFPIGRGESASEAYENLLRRLELIEPTKVFPPKSDLMGWMWVWDLRWPSGLRTEVDRCWRGSGRGPVLNR
jgi:hypothetical protein